METVPALHQTPSQTEFQRSSRCRISNGPYTHGCVGSIDLRQRLKKRYVDVSEAVAGIGSKLGDVYKAVLPIGVSLDYRGLLKPGRRTVESAQRVEHLALGRGRHTPMGARGFRWARPSSKMQSGRSPGLPESAYDNALSFCIE